jgi:hypothetical protein
MAELRSRDVDGQRRAAEFAIFFARVRGLHRAPAREERPPAASVSHALFGGHVTQPLQGLTRRG